ncbi:hypothetical protein [Sphingomonas sp. GB1N7]|uniref:hypothetical protein n=1 Tax=Parasphingomonas caseinilytica TaxID=3096158 RepID=UPI002FC66018
MTAKKALIDFEGRVDRHIVALPICSLSARAFLAGLHRYLFQFRNANVQGLTEIPGMADRFVTRLSALIGIIVNLPNAPSRESASDMIETFQAADPDGRQFTQLLSYMAFSETMPEVHKNLYDITDDGVTFELKHHTSASADFEARDILLSELALVFPLAETRKLDPELDTLAAMAPEHDAVLVEALLKRKMLRLLGGMAEPNLVTEAGMRNIFGFKYRTFYLIRTALLAYAEFCAEMGWSLALRDGVKGSSEETLEWISVSYNAETFIDLLVTLSQTKRTQVERMLELLSIDFRRTPARHHGGDGFFPPFARFDDFFVFSPELVMTQTHLRNLVSAFIIEQAAKVKEGEAQQTDRSNRTRKDRPKSKFDTHVSKDLEPVLIGQAQALFLNSGAWKVKPNVKFRNGGDVGELDLIVAGPRGPVLLIQAKGMLPPHGARLTRNLADQMKKGLAQIRSFRDLPIDVQERIASRAVGRPVAHADIRHSLLARACFGTPDIVTPGLDVSLVTLPMLSLALGKMRAEADPIDVDTLVARVTEVELAFLEAAAPKWSQMPFTVSDRQIVQPRLDFDDRAVDVWRRISWEDSVIMPADPVMRPKPSKT